LAQDTALETYRVFIDFFRLFFVTRLFNSHI